MKGQHRQFATAARTAQVNGPVLVADPQLVILDESNGGITSTKMGRSFTAGISSNSLRIKGAPFLEPELLVERRRL